MKDNVGAYNIPTHSGTAERDEYVANKLDFNLIPEYEFTATFMNLPGNLEAAIRHFPQTEERIEGALMFCARVMNCDPDKVSDAARRAGACRIDTSCCPWPYSG